MVGDACFARLLDNRPRDVLVSHSLQAVLAVGDRLASIEIGGDKDRIHEEAQSGACISTLSLIYANDLERTRASLIE